VFGKTSKDFSNHFLIGVGLAKQFEVVGYVGESCEHVLDSFVGLHFE